NPLDGVNDFITSAVVECDIQDQAGIVSGFFACLPDFALKMRRDFLKPANMPDLNAFAVEFVQLAVNHRLQDAHQKLDFAPGPSPVLGREGVDRQNLHAKLDRGPDNTAQVLRAVTVSFSAWQPTRGRPSPVAIHDDGDVF